MKCECCHKPLVMIDFIEEHNKYSEVYICLNVDCEQLGVEIKREVG